jgi:hypothetical protein
MKLRTGFGIALATIGLVPILIEFAFYFRSSAHGQHYDVSPWVMLGGAVICFVGGFVIDSKKAESAGGFLVDSSVKVIGVIRSGRRSSDNVIVAAPAAESVGAPPAAAQPVPDLQKIPAPEKGP